MFSILKKLFGNKGQENLRPIHGSATQPISISSISKSKTPLDSLRQEVKKYGNPDYPFLSKDYSPNSRVPSTDLTSFIIDRLRSNDISSVIDLMHEVLSANPGLGTGPEWIDKEIREIIEIKFDKYLRFTNPDHYNQLKAMWIVASKDGGGREFWITDEKPQLFSWALCCYLPDFQPSMAKLVDKANRFISKMANDTPYWKDYPKFSKVNMIVSPPEGSKCFRKIAELSISARLHFFFAAEAGGGSLPTLTNYAIRSFGISIEETTSQLQKSGLLISSSEPPALSNSLSKQELIDVCAKAKVDVRKSWSKDKLSQTLYDNNPEYFDSLMKDMNVVGINPEYETEIKALKLYAKEISQAFKVLCFI